MKKLLIVLLVFSAILCTMLSVSAADDYLVFTFDEAADSEYGFSAGADSLSNDLRSAVRKPNSSEPARNSVIQKIFAENAVGSTSNAYLQKTKFKTAQDISDYRYISFWAYADANAEWVIEFHLKKENGQDNCSTSATLSGKEWKRYSYPINPTDASVTGLNFAIKSAEKGSAIYIDDIMLSKTDLTQYDYFSLPLEITKDGAAVANEALEPGAYTVTGKVMSNKAETVGNAAYILGAFDQKGELKQTYLQMPKNFRGVEDMADTSNSGEIKSTIEIEESGLTLKAFLWSLDNLDALTNVAE